MTVKSSDCIQMEPELGEWKPIADFPKTREPFLGLSLDPEVCLNLVSDSVGICVYDREQNQFLNTLEMQPVTLDFWMPLPELPKLYSGEEAEHKVTEEWSNLRFCKSSNSRLREIALKSHWRSLGLISEPTREEQLKAVKDNWRAIAYIDTPDDEMIRIALAQDIKAARAVKNLTPEQRLFYLEHFPLGVEWLVDLTHEELIFAASKTIKALKHAPDTLIEAIDIDKKVTLRYCN